MTVAEAEIGGLREPARAMYPDDEGYVERDGVRLFYEVYGDGDPTLVCLCPGPITHSRLWKAQVPYIGRHGRAVVYDPRGNGKSGRPRGVDAYSVPEMAQDTLAVMDATDTGQCVLLTVSGAARHALWLLANHPDRFSGAVFIGPFLPFTHWQPVETARRTFEQPKASRRALRMIFETVLDLPVAVRSPSYRRFARQAKLLEAVDRFSRDSWFRDQRGFLEWNFGVFAIPEAHSTRQLEEAVTFGMETDPEALVDAHVAMEIADDAILTQRDEILAYCARVTSQVLVITGDHDIVTPPEWSAELAEATGGRLIEVPECGHVPMVRKPAVVNLALRDFVEREAPQPDPTVHRSANGGTRALFVSSPIGLGHAQRDVAIAKELRALKPDLQIDWLAQDPVTRVLEGEGETIHPESVHLASESGHFRAESTGHDLHCFQAFRRMDEILVANFMLFHDVVTDERYDLWIADEGWEVDHFLHEHPELKRAPYAFLTDFVGWLPMPDGGEREAFLTADYNAEMVEHIRDHPQVRDRSIFIGNPDDIVDERLGPDLPTIREWTEQHFDFVGYTSEFDPAQLPDRETLRAELGYGADEKVCIATVGGSGIGEALLGRVIDAYPEAKRRVPELRLIVVAGPRIDPASLPHSDGLEIHPYVHNLYRHLTACDLAVVQGGLGTTMELAASRRPFIYVPLEHHCEQQYHVHHRLKRYGAGRRLDYADASPDAMAEAIAQQIGREVDYRPVETDGARRAAERIAELL